MHSSIPKEKIKSLKSFFSFSCYFQLHIVFFYFYSFLVFLTHKNEAAAKVNNGDSAINSKFLSSHPIHVDVCDGSIANKIYLACKDIPLLIKKSNFAKNSACHAEKIAKLRLQQTLILVKTKLLFNIQQASEI